MSSFLWFRFAIRETWTEDLYISVALLNTQAISKHRPIQLSLEQHLLFNCRKETSLCNKPYAKRREGPYYKMIQPVAFVMDYPNKINFPQHKIIDQMH